MGKIAIVPLGIKKGIINQALLKLTPNHTIVPQFLKYWMESKSFQYQIEEHSKGAAIKNVASVKILKEIVVPLPKIEQQQSIISELNILSHKSEKLYFLYKKEMAALDDLKKSILQKAFAGELLNECC